MLHVSIGEFECYSCFKKFPAFSIAYDLPSNEKLCPLCRTKWTYGTEEASNEDWDRVKVERAELLIAYWQGELTKLKHIKENR